MRWLVVPLIIVSGCATTGVHAPHVSDAPQPLKLLEPDNKAIVKTARPLLRWTIDHKLLDTLPPEKTKVEIALCLDRTCKHELGRLTPSGTSTQPPEDLPNGIVFMRGRIGRLSWTNPGYFIVDTRIVIEGKHVEAIVPPEQLRMGERLVVLADKSMELFSAILGLPVPESRSRVYFYVNDEHRQAALEGVVRRWSLTSNTGYTFPDLGSHVVMFPRMQRADCEAVGNLEALVLHELAHAFVQSQVQLSSDLPTWFAEGIAELLAERAVTALSGASSLQNTYFSGRLAIVRKALDEHRQLSWKEIFSKDRDATNPHNPKALLFYSSVYAIFHFLDLATSPARQAKFHDFLREVANMRGFFVAAQVRSQMQKLLGDLGPLEQEWQKFVISEPLGPFEVPRGELRQTSSGYLLESALNTWAGAISTGAPLGENQALEMTVDFTDPETQKAQVVLNYQGQHDFAAVELTTRGELTLFRVENKKPLTVLTKVRLPAAVGHTAPHTLHIALRDHNIAVLLDGRNVLDAPLTLPLAGRWGVATHDGRLIFRDAKLVAITAN